MVPENRAGGVLSLAGGEGFMAAPVFRTAAGAPAGQVSASTGGALLFVNVSSVHEELPFPNFAAYCASKGGLKMLTRNLAVELGPLGITINSVAPGAITTPINTALLHDPVKLKSLTEQIPLARLGTTDDVAGVAVFLASDEAGYVTGSTYVVDGGLTWYYQEQ